MSFTNKQYISAGEIINYLSLALNICMTSAAMLGWPNKSAYDAGWTTSGFCIADSDYAILPTELVCFLSLTSSAIAAFVFSKKSKVGESLKVDNPLLAERIEAAVFANAAHGFGHAFIWVMGSATPPLELSLAPAAIANILMLMAFWVGTLKSVVGLPTKSASAMAIIVLSVQYVLRVPPELAFTYSQSVILAGGSLNQLTRKKEYYEKKNGFLFFAIALQFFILFPLYYLEMFNCSQVFLSMLGGHAIYDLWLSLAPFGLYYAVTTMIELGSSSDSSNKKKGD